MQPYFLPYIGYFQLINMVDEFIIYDNIQYTKKGWINRNRILQNDKPYHITLPLKKASDYLDVKDRYIADNFDRKKLLSQVKSAYSKAPYYPEIFEYFKTIIMFNDQNLFAYTYNSILKILEILDIKTKIDISSHIPINHNLKSQEKVLAFCRYKNATTYINPPGGVLLYDKLTFKDNNIDLQFQKPIVEMYKQYNNEFVDSLSILDVLMFNGIEKTRLMIKKHDFLID